MKISEQLKAAKALIDTPEKWTQKVPARDMHDCNVEFDSKQACKFCSVGAIWKIGTTADKLGSYNDRDTIKYLNKACDRWIALYNDTHSHEQVMIVWDKAIALAENEGK